MSHRQSFTCLLRSESLLWWNKLQNQVRGKAARLMLRHVVFLRAFFFWRGILLKAQSTKSQTLSAHLTQISLIHSLYLVCTCGSCVRCLVFLLAERPHVPPPLYLRNVPSFFLTGHVYLCLIKQAPHFLMPGPQTGSLLAQHPGLPRRRALP